MTNQQKLNNYKNYVDAEVEMERVPMPFNEFIESLTIDDPCNLCKKSGESICGNDVLNFQCFESED